MDAAKLQAKRRSAGAGPVVVSYYCDRPNARPECEDQDPRAPTPEKKRRRTHVQIKEERRERELMSALEPAEEAIMEKAAVQSRNAPLVDGIYPAPPPALAAFIMPLVEEPEAETHAWWARVLARWYPFFTGAVYVP
eukprot:tig00000180_g13635.t1